MDPLNGLLIAWAIIKARNGDEKKAQLDTWAQFTRERTEESARILQISSESLKRECKELEREFSEVVEEAQAESAKMKEAADKVRALLPLLQSARRQLEGESSQRSAALEALTDQLNRLCK